MGYVIEEALGWKKVAVRCRLQRRLGLDYRLHTVNIHPDGFFVDSTLEQFDYKKFGYLYASMELPFPEDLHEFVSNGIPPIALLSKETPLFEIDPMETRTYRSIPTPSATLALCSLFPDRFDYIIHLQTDYLLVDRRDRNTKIK